MSTWRHKRTREFFLFLQMNERGLCDRQVVSGCSCLASDETSVSLERSVVYVTWWGWIRDVCLLARDMLPARVASCFNKRHTIWAFFVLPCLVFSPTWEKKCSPRGFPSSWRVFRGRGGGGGGGGVMPVPINPLHLLWMSSALHPSSY